jgi:alpha-mannosidase
MVLTLKRAEDGDGIILRLIETEGEGLKTRITMPGLTIRKAYRTDLVERNISELPSAEHSVTVPVGAFGITTIRIQVSG